MMEGRLRLAIRESINSVTQENPVSGFKWRLRDRS
jgi:predicted secreted protein